MVEAGGEQVLDTQVKMKKELEAQAKVEEREAVEKEVEELRKELEEDEKKDASAKRRRQQQRMQVHLCGGIPSLELRASDSRTTGAVPTDGAARTAPPRRLLLHMRLPPPRQR